MIFEQVLDVVFALRFAQLPDEEQPCPIQRVAIKEHRSHQRFNSLSSASRTTQITDAPAQLEQTLAHGR